jgi:hypothetical protein
MRRFEMLTRYLSSPLLRSLKMAFCISLRILPLYFTQLIFQNLGLSCFRKGKMEKLYHLWVVLSLKRFCAIFSDYQMNSNSWHHRRAHMHQYLYRSQLLSTSTVPSLLCPTPAWSLLRTAHPNLKSQHALRKSQRLLSACTHQAQSCGCSFGLLMFFRHLTSQNKRSDWCTYPHSPSTTILNMICL